MPKKKQVYPRTKEIEFKEELHGTRISDPYRWLEQDSEEVHQWIEKQNAYTRSILDNISMRENIKERLNQLFRQDTIGVPVPRKGRYFFRERKANEDLSVLYVQDGLNDTPRSLIDPNILSPDKTTTLRGWYPSRDGKLLAYALSEASNDQTTIQILNVDTGEDLADIIPAELYPGFNTWGYDNKGFYYTRRHPDAPKGEEKLHKKIYYHKLGDDCQNDRMIFGKDLEKTDWPSMGTYGKGRYLLVSVWKSTGEERNELYLCDIQSSKQEFIPIIKDVDALFSASIYKDILYIHTNHNAPRWKLMTVKIKNTHKGINAWKTLIPEGEYTLEYFTIMKNTMFVETLENVHSVFRRYTLNGTMISEIPMPSLSSLTAVTGEQNGDELFFSISSFIISTTIYLFDLKTEEIQVFKKLDAGIDTKQYQTKQIWYESKDKTKIPMFLIHKKNIERNGNNPAVLYGYGGFNIS